MLAYGLDMADLKLGYNTGYWSAGPPKGALEAVQEAEKLGFNSVWTAEAYGSDATSPLAYLAAVTKRIRLGTSIMQLAARTPAMAAMQAATIDALVNNRSSAMMMTSPLSRFVPTECATSPRAINVHFGSCAILIVRSDAITTSVPWSISASL